MLSNKLRAQKNTTPTLDIYLMRHGQTEFNKTGYIQGWSDSPLTKEGIAELVKAGKKLADANIKFDAAFSSSSQRAIDTAHILLHCTQQPEMPITAINELREYRFGAFEQQLVSEVHQFIAEERGYANVEDWLTAYRNASYNMLAETIARLDPEQVAENETEFLSRVQNGLFQVIADSPHDRNARVLVVSHGMSITAILKSIDPMSTLYKSVPNASVTHLRYSLIPGLEIVSIADGGLGGKDTRPQAAPPSQVAKALGFHQR